MAFGKHSARDYWSCSLQLVLLNIHVSPIVIITAPLVCVHPQQYDISTASLASFVPVRYIHTFYFLFFDLFRIVYLFMYSLDVLMIRLCSFTMMMQFLKSSMLKNCNVMVY